MREWFRSCDVGYDAAQLAQIEQLRENVRFLAGYKLPAELGFESNDSRIFDGCDLIVSAVPCQFMRRVWERLKPCYPDGVAVVSVAKGIENETLMLPRDILKDVLGDGLRFAVLSGPTIADELVRDLPATACSASEDMHLAREVQEAFSRSYFRVYTNDDVTGVEVAGAMKNVIAISAGIIDGIGAGDNAKAALLCRGLAEITRFGEAMGAHSQTFAGLSGLGDLVTTCISPKGRNRSFGERIGRGMSVQEALAATNSVVEGAATCESVMGLSAKLNVDMPITKAVYEILFENKSVQDALSDLMSRKLKSE